MKNKFDLFKPAIALAETLMGETNQKKIHDAVSAAFDTTKAHDADFASFQNFVHEYKARFEGLKNQTSEGEKIRLAEEKLAAAKAAKEKPAVKPV